jgi:hypothetical protein
MTSFLKDRIVKVRGGGRMYSGVTGQLWPGQSVFISLGPPYGDDRNRFAVLEVPLTNICRCART